MTRRELESGKASADTRRAAMASKSPAIRAEHPRHGDDERRPARARQYEVVAWDEV
jgi:hypothetical protein